MLEDAPGYRNLLAPPECLVVLIGGTDSGTEDASVQQASLLEAAEDEGVPAIVLIGDDMRAVPGRAHALCCSCLNPLADPEVRRALLARSRSRLILGGAQAETVLTFTALSALEEGFDVYLLRDLCLGASDLLAETAAMRLVQAGAVPVSVVQVIAEWGCVSRDGDRVRPVALAV